MGQHRPGEQLPMVKFREMIRLHELGYNQSEIARSCVVARATVQDYLRRAAAKGLSYDQLAQMSDSEAQALLGKGKPPPVDATTVDFEPVHRELQRKGVTLALRWQEGLDQSAWTFSYAQFCRRYGQWKGQPNLSMRQVDKGGEKVFVDYCGLTVTVIEAETGTESEARIFVACLGASSYTFAEATPLPGVAALAGIPSTSSGFLGRGTRRHRAR